MHKIFELAIEIMEVEEKKSYLMYMAPRGRSTLTASDSRSRGRVR